MEKDWLSTAVKQRRPWNSKELEPWNQLAFYPLVFWLWWFDFLICALTPLNTWYTNPWNSSPTKGQLQPVCGAYLACLEQFKALVPQKFAGTALVEINKAFPIWIIGLIWFDNNVDACIFGYFWGMNQVYPAISNQQPRFEMRHADADIIALMENTVPPADINKIAIFAAPLAKYHAEVGCGHQTELSVVYFEWTTAIINWWTYITSYHIGWL